MRSLALLATLLAAAPAVAGPPGETPVQIPEDATVPPAQPSSPPVSVDYTKVPEPCVPLAKATQSPSAGVAVPARISLASCLADHALRGLQLIDAEESVRAVGAAVQPSLTLLDDVINGSDPGWKLVALHARGELLAGLVLRMESTVPPPAANANEDAYRLHDLRVSMLQPLLDPWRKDARDAFVQVDKAARTDPQLAKNNRMVAVAVQDAQRRLQAIATR